MFIILSDTRTVIVLGNLNYRMRVPPSEMFDRVQHASVACQARFEEERELLRGGAGLEWSWRRGAGYNRLWTLRDPEDLEIPEGVPFLHARASSCGGHGSEAGGWGIGLADIAEGKVHRGRHPHDHGGGGSSSPFSPQPFEEAWAWVKEKDVLSQRMAQGLLLHRFREAPIAFPPTFKWRVEASAEDCTEREVLKAAFVTGTRRANAYPQWSPSYTDRILVHSIGDVEHRCILGAYDMCDEGPLAQVSDHRPVSLALALIVDTSQLPSLDDLGRRRHPGASSDTANAMALAAVQRQDERRRRSGSLGSIERLLMHQRQPSAGPHAFPLLVCLAFSRFRFNFRGFDVLRDTSRHGVSQELLKGEEEEVKEGRAYTEEEQAERGEGGQLEPVEPQPLPTTASGSAAPGLRRGVSRSRWMRLPSFKREGSGRSGGGGGALGRRGARQEGAQSEEEEERLSIIDHVVILYPLPSGECLCVWGRGGGARFVVVDGLKVRGWIGILIAHTIQPSLHPSNRGPPPGRAARTAAG